MDKSEWEVSPEKPSGCSVFQLNIFSFTRTSFLRAFRKANMNFLTRTGHIFPLRPKISSQSCWFVMPKNDLVLLRFCSIHGFKEYVSLFILRVILLPKWETSCSLSVNLLLESFCVSVLVSWLIKWYTVALFFLCGKYLDEYASL